MISCAGSISYSVPFLFSSTCCHSVVLCTMFTGLVSVAGVAKMAIALALIALLDSHRTVEACD